jgi:hypothetical protein
VCWHFDFVSSCTVGAVGHFLFTTGKKKALPSSYKTWIFAMEKVHFPVNGIDDSK